MRGGAENGVGSPCYVALRGTREDLSEKFCQGRGNGWADTVDGERRCACSAAPCVWSDVRFRPVIGESAGLPPAVRTTQKPVLSAPWPPGGFLSVRGSLEAGEATEDGYRTPSPHTYISLR